MSKLNIAIGAAVITGLGIAGIANAEENEGLFAMDELSSGYMIAGAHDGAGDDDDTDTKDGEGKCGEGKCGGDKGETHIA
jgi:uncharacterized low-complexity protein